MDQDALIENFKSITNENAERSRFYLESSNWDLSVALTSFYDHAADFDTTSYVTPPTGAMPPTGASGKDTEFHDAQEDVADTQDSKNKSSSENSRFHSLADYNQAGSKEGEESDEEGQEYYAGGSEHSGEVIIGPGKKSGKDFVKQMFKNARKHGAVPVDQAESSSQEKQGATYFSGGGYKLGETSDDHRFIPAPEGSAEKERKPLDVILKLWRDGFTIGDGPLRSYHEEESSVFLGAVAKGEIPQELIRLAQGGEVNLDMEDHKHEEYKPQKIKMAPFAGEGHTLGGVTPTVVSREAPTKPLEMSPMDSKVAVDENSPVTTIRIQLGDGSRVTQRFNHYHTVAQLYSFVRDSIPGDSRHFVLLTTFPNKELKEDLTSLKEGSLLNAVIVQRFK